MEGVAEVVRRLLGREPTGRPWESEALAEELFAALGVAEEQAAARQMAAVVAEQQRLRKEEAQLAAAMQAQGEALRRQEKVVVVSSASSARRLRSVPRALVIALLSSGRWRCADGRL